MEGYTPDSAKNPFPEYLRTGIPVCLNTDDRGMWDSNLTDEYYTAVTAFNLSWPELVSLARSSIVYSFVQPDVKAALLADYERDVGAFESRMTGADWHESIAGVEPVIYGYAKRKWGLEVWTLGPRARGPHATAASWSALIRPASSTVSSRLM